MKIWFTEIGEPLPLEKDVRLHRYGTLTPLLASMGHDVTWWTSNFSHAPKEFVVPGDLDTQLKGVRLRILAGPGYQRNVSIRRFRHQADFARRFFEQASGCEAPDLIVTPIPTLEAAEKAVLYALKNRIPVVTDIRDEWPDDLANLAPKGFRWTARLLLREYYRKARFVCSNASGIIGVSQRMVDFGLRLAEREAGIHDAVFPFGYTPEPIEATKVEQARQWWNERGVTDGPFRCCFFGTIGRFFDLETVIKATGILSKEFDIQTVLCGSGSRLPRLQRIARNQDSIIFPGWIDAPKIAALMEMSHVGLTPYASDERDRFSLTNKPFEYFAGGLPIANSSYGELRTILDQHHCGLTYPSSSVDQLVSILRRFWSQPKEREEMGRRARGLLESDFTTERIAQKLDQHLRTVQNAFPK